MVFWNVMLCNQADMYQHFKWTWCPNLHGRTSLHVPWLCMQYGPLKLWYLPTTLHGVTSQNTKHNIHWHENLKPQQADVRNGINDTSSYSNVGNFYSRINLFFHLKRCFKWYNIPYNQRAVEELSIILTSGIKMLTDFWRHFPREKCALWGRKYGMYSPNYRLVDFADDIMF